MYCGEELGSDEDLDGIMKLYCYNCGKYYE